ncbi:MAG: hypothetical protein IIU23_07055, partial [Bacteroidales bacterium]|nr:hypothetical protein [Bacteroidales bacterium]
ASGISMFTRDAHSPLISQASPIAAMITSARRAMVAFRILYICLIAVKIDGGISHGAVVAY